jgi:hypothetical protein
MMSQFPPGQMFILLNSDGLKLFEKKEETVTSPLSAIQRETVTDPVDPVAPIDVPRDIAVGHKRLAWARQNL